MKTVVIDTSSAILLFRSGMISYLVSEYCTVMTKAVQDEIINNGYPGSDEFRQYFSRKGIRILPRIKTARVTSKGLSKLDKGERETILAYSGGTGDFIIIDDGPGAGFCRKRSIPYINALLVPRILYESQMISRRFFNAKFQKITGIGRYSKNIIDYAYNCSGTDLEYFLP